MSGQPRSAPRWVTAPPGVSPRKPTSTSSTSASASKLTINPTPITTATAAHASNTSTVAPHTPHTPRVHQHASSSSSTAPAGSHGPPPAASHLPQRPSVPKPNVPKPMSRPRPPSPTPPKHLLQATASSSTPLSSSSSPFPRSTTQHQSPPTVVGRPNGTTLRTNAFTTSAVHAYNTVPRIVPAAPTVRPHAPDSAPAAQTFMAATDTTPSPPPSPSPPAAQPSRSSASAPLQSASKLRIEKTTDAAAMPRPRVDSPASTVSTKLRASPPPSSKVRPPARRRIVETETPPPGRGSTPLTRHRASSEVKPALSSDALEFASEAGRPRSAAGREEPVAGTSASAAGVTPLESAPSTPAGSIGGTAAKKRTRRGWKGWAIEVVDEEGNTFIRSPSPEPAPDPNQPRRKRGRPRKNPLPDNTTAPAAGAAAPETGLETAAVAPAAARVAPEVEAAAEATAQAETVEVEAVGAQTEVVALAPGRAAMNGGYRTHRNIFGSGESTDEVLRPTVDAGSDLSTPPPEEAPPPPEPEPMPSGATGKKRQRDPAATAPGPSKRLRPSRGTTPPSYAEPTELVENLFRPEAGPSSRRGSQSQTRARPSSSPDVKTPDVTRRRPGRPPKSKAMDIDSSAAEGEKQADLPATMVELSKDSNATVTVPVSAALRPATSGSTNTSHAREGKAPRAGRKSGPASTSKALQRTLHDFATMRDDRSAPSKILPPESRPVADKKLTALETSEVQTLPPSKGAHMRPVPDRDPSSPPQRRLPSIADEAKAIIAASKARNDREAKEQSAREAEKQPQPTPRERTPEETREQESAIRSIPRESPPPLHDFQDIQERAEARDRPASFDPRHQERAREIPPGHGLHRRRESQKHERRTSFGPSPSEFDDNSREHERDRSYHADGRRNSLPHYEESVSSDLRTGLPDTRERQPDPRVNGIYMPHGPSGFPRVQQYYAPPQLAPPGHYGYQPGFYPAPPVRHGRPPPHLSLQHPVYVYGPPMTSPRDHTRALYDSSAQEWYGHNGPPPGYAVTRRGPTAPAAPPPLESRRPPSQGGAPRSPNDHSSHSQLHPIRASPADYSVVQLGGPIRELAPDMRGDSRVADPRSATGEHGRERREVMAEVQHARQYPERRDCDSMSYTNVVPIPFPTGPQYRPPEPRPLRLDPRYPSVALAPPGTAPPVPSNKTDQIFAKEHANGFEGLDPSLQDNARGFVENVRNNLRTMVGTYFLEPSSARDAFLERIGRDLIDLGWMLTDGSDGALYSRGGPPWPHENGSQQRARDPPREWRPVSHGRLPQPLQDQRPSSADGPNSARSGS
ncbi:unnamed protein product [Cutaneotrichosporon oleaginosum]